MTHWVHLGTSASILPQRTCMQCRKEAPGELRIVTDLSLFFLCLLIACVLESISKAWSSELVLLIVLVQLPSGVCVRYASLGYIKKLINVIHHISRVRVTDINTIPSHNSVITYSINIYSVSPVPDTVQYSEYSSGLSTTHTTTTTSNNDQAPALMELTF